MRITVGGLKGGIGKTTSAAFIATALAQDGPTLAVDADPQSQSLFDWYQMAVEAGYELPWACHPWVGDDLARRVRMIAPEYKHVVIDTGGETSRLFRAAVAVAGELVIPVRANPIEMRRIPATLEAAGEVEDIAEVEIYPRVLLVCTTRSKDVQGARDFLKANDPPIPTMDAQVRQGVLYSRAFGTVPADLGDYAAVVAELTAAAAA
ncbi:ParA family partition ATPase [Dactylosporangium matsuzakiense]|uniref:ParA family protein n=1 Tax=Dactylosporangium matsuzakiense TaxID=53360 RepID=UPI0031EAE6AF